MESLQPVSVYYLNDEEKMSEFRRNHYILNDLSLAELTEMIIIYNQLYMELTGKFNLVLKGFDDLTNMVNKLSSYIEKDK
jgi:hypothetical protein